MEIINNLKQEGKLPNGVEPKDFTEEQWSLVEGEMNRVQKENYERGNTIGIEKGMTPWQQAERDKNDPKLKDPLRDNPQNNSQGENKG